MGRRRNMAFYLPNTFAVPTTGRGPFLFNPGVTGRPSMNGGLGAVSLPNMPTFQNARAWRRRDAANAPMPVYQPSAATQVTLSGLGAVAPGSFGPGRGRVTGPVPVAGHQSALRIASQPIAQPIVIQGGTITPTPGNWRQRRQSGGGQQQNQGTIIGYTNAGAAIYGSPPSGSWQNAQNSVARGYGGRSSAQGGTVTGYDAAGNPVYSTPPPGAYQVGTDIYGNPLYSNNASAAAAANANGGSASNAQGAVSYDSDGNPVYSTPPAGATVTGTDADGNPIYGTAAASGTSWFSQDSLGLGFNNGIYCVIGVGLVLIFKKK